MDAASVLGLLARFTGLSPPARPTGSRMCQPNGKVSSGARNSYSGTSPRGAEMLNEAALPSVTHPQIFIAQGFDAQDPVGDANWASGVRASLNYGSVLMHATFSPLQRRASASSSLVHSLDFKSCNAGSTQLTQWRQGWAVSTAKSLRQRRAALGTAHLFTWVR